MEIGKDLIAKFLYELWLRELAPDISFWAFGLVFLRWILYGVGEIYVKKAWLFLLNYLLI